MITAKEATALYDEHLLVRDRYISEVIEPLIKKHAPKSKKITLAIKSIILMNWKLSLTNLAHLFLSITGN